MEEKWKIIEDFKDYEVSNTGKIRNMSGEIIKERINNRGYHIISLYSNSLCQTAMVHRLVAKAFVLDSGLNPDGSKMKGKHQVNHKNGDKNNNSINNLEWCDQSYNMKEAYRLNSRKYTPHTVTEEY